MKIPRELSRDTGRGIVISKVPDVCRSPVCPVPYTIVAKQADDANTAPTVRMTGERAHKQTSIITQCSGDEPGTGLGIKSGTVKSVCHRKTHSSNVRIEGQWATRHLDEWWMNNRNTFGVLYFIEDQKLYDAAPVIAWKLEGHPEIEPLEQDVESPMTASFASLSSISSLASQMAGSEPESTDETRQMYSGLNPEDAWLNSQQQAQRAAPRVQPRVMPGTGIPRQFRFDPRLRPFNRRHRYNPNHQLPGNRLNPQTDFFNNPSVPYTPPNAYLGTPPVWRVPPGVGRIPPGDLTMLPEPDGEAVFGREPLFRAADGKVYNEAEIQREWDSVCRPSPTPLVDPAFNTDLDRITRRRNDPCKTGRYGSLKCNTAIGEQAHHIVPDYTLRYGTRAEGISGQKRIPGLPSYYDGPAICLIGQAKLAGDEHGIAHLADADIAAMGQGTGMAPISDITKRSLMAIGAARPECFIQAVAEVAKQPSLNSATKGRTTISPPHQWPPNSGLTP